jgi:hypothetical protein
VKGDGQGCREISVRRQVPDAAWLGIAALPPPPAHDTITSADRSVLSALQNIQHQHRYRGIRFNSVFEQCAGSNWQSGSGCLDRGLSRASRNNPDRDSVRLHGHDSIPLHYFTYHVSTVIRVTTGLTSTFYIATKLSSSTQAIVNKRKCMHRMDSFHMAAYTLKRRQCDLKHSSHHLLLDVA